MGKKTAYSLVRFSSDKQEMGTSRARQLDRCRYECDRRGWAFDEQLCIADLGVSAYRGKNFKPRYALGKFIEASKQGLLLPNPVLIIENPDRFSRDLIDNADSELWGLVKRGVDVLFLSNGLLLTKGDENDPGKRAILLFEFHRSHQESQRKSDLVTAAWVTRRKEAVSGKRVQFGNWRPGWVDYVNEEFRLNDRAKTVRRVIDDYLAGDSMAAIARTMNREGVRPIGCGRRWTQGAVGYLLHTELLAGHTVVKGQRLEHYYPAVLSDDEWTRLQAMLAQNKARKGGSRVGEQIVNLFRNRCFCAACGGPIGSNRGGNGTQYYKCLDARYGRCKVRSMVPVAAIEQDFFGAYLAQNPSEILSKQDAAHQQKIAAIQARLASLDGQVKVAVELIGVVAGPELRKKLETLEAERTAAKQELEQETRNSIATSQAPAAYSDIRKALSGGGLEIHRASLVLAEQLADDSIRRKLLLLIPSVIQGLVIDLENWRYAARTLAGEVSDWRDLSSFSMTAR